MKKISIILSLFLAIFASCTDLDERLYDQILEDDFPENATQAALIPVATYQAMRPFVDNGGWWFAQEVTSDEMVCPTRDTDWDDGGKWRVLHQHTWDNNTEAINTMWSTFYNGVFEANKAIEFLSPATTEGAKITIAKLKTMRAYYYYLLIDNYGDVPYITSFSNAPEQPTTEAKAVIFNDIVTSIEENLKYLSVSTNKLAVTKGMAFSLLAKLYLNAEVYTGTPQWAKAEAYCDSIIDMGIYSLESEALAPFVTNNENSIENIFTIPYDKDGFKGFNLHMRTLHYNSNLTFNMLVGPWNGFAVMEDHYNTYAANDDRKAGFLVGQQYTYTGVKIRDAGAPDIAQNPSNLILDPHIPALLIDASYSKVEIRMSGARVAKFEIALGASDNLSNDFPIFRYADILLMKAETMIRQGKNGDSYVNMIRNRAGLGNWSGTTLEQLLAERGREMFWEAHRRQDLIRFGEFNKAWWEKSASTADRNTFPIPQWAIDSNPNLAN